MNVSGSLDKMEVVIESQDIYCVASTFAYIAVPLLKRLRDLQAGYPADMTQEEWDKILDKMIVAFELVGKNNGSWWQLTKKEWKKITKGHKLFMKYYFDLWT